MLNRGEQTTESRDRLRWPASVRNGGRNQIGTVADIKSESPAGLRRNSHRDSAKRRHRINFSASGGRFFAITLQRQNYYALDDAGPAPA